MSSSQKRQKYTEKSDEKVSSVDQQQQLLQKTLQNPHQTQQPREQQDYQQVSPNSKYVKQEHYALKNDYQDHNYMQEQIKRIKKIKHDFKQQKQQIQQLNKVMDNLKQENKDLRLEKDSIREKSLKKQILRSNQKSQRNNMHQKSNLLRGNIVNAKNQIQGKMFNIQNVNVQRYLSPQVGRRIQSNNNMRNLHGRHQRNQSYTPHDVFKIDQEILSINHQHNKRTVIASFVEQLKQQLEQNQSILQRQKKSHRQTKQKLEACLQEITDLRIRLDRQRNYDVLERQNLQIRRQLQSEVGHRLQTEQRLRQKDLLIAQYEPGFVTRCSDFDRELDKMDQIYFNIQQTL